MTALKPYVPRAINRAPDPTMESGIVGAQQSNNASLYPIVADTTVKHSGAQSWKCTRTATTPSVTLASLTVCAATAANTVVLRVTPGEVLSAAVMCKCAVPGHRIQMNAVFRDAANTQVGTTTNGAIKTNVSLVDWDTVGIDNLTAPANANHVYFTLAVYNPIGVNSVGGEVSWADSLIVNGGPKAEPYFDGSTPGCSWSGTPNQSQSVRAAVTPWTRWSGTAEQPLDVAGQWDGAALHPIDLRDVTVA